MVRTGMSSQCRFRLIQTPINKMLIGVDAQYILELGGGWGFDEKIRNIFNEKSLDEIEISK
jgi:hypothetical protein